MQLLQNLKRTAKRAYIRWQWNRFVLLNERTEELMNQWLLMRLDSAESDHVGETMRILRMKQAVIARSIGLSESSIGLPCRRTRGRLPQAPEWLLAKA